ncbi:MAG: DUF1176 domain-containing protein [Rhizobium sp.]|nr:DUF1176 domain-containing protein [Rhizobium sp.]
MTRFLCALALSVQTLVASPALATDDSADIIAARNFAEPALGRRCDFATDDNARPADRNNVFHLAFRTKGQDQDSPDHRRTLVQLTCSTGAYNFNSVFALRNDDPDEGGWEVLSFAQPLADFDYLDEAFTKLRAPPTVSGYIAVTELTNSVFDIATKTISSHAKWRGVGDAWSAGTWEFRDGAFVLKHFEIDPTYQAADGDADPAAAESYMLFGNSTPLSPAD